MITQPINENALVALRGNTRPEANAANDRGPVADTLAMDHMILQLRRPAAQQQALDVLIDHLHDPKSPDFHHWLSAGEFGMRFGPAAQDTDTIVRWLQQHGFAVNVLYPSHMVIDFSGTAGQVSAAFHTEIHNLSVNGVAHIANMTDPQIPAALAPAIVGIVSLHDFRPHGFVPPSTAYSGGTDCERIFQVIGTCYQVMPADLATIYNFNPIFTAGNTGQNQTIYLIEDSDLFADSDWTTFRSMFGLSGYTGASLTTIHPSVSGSTNCSDPGATGNDGEATLDAEWSSAAAPSAAIVMATCADTSTTSGLLISIENLINGANPPAIMSLSYLDCEPSHGAAGNAAYNAIYQQGVAEGTSIFVSAGDQGATQCDYKTTDATHGIAVNGLGSTPYNVAVGGTDFGDTYLGLNSTYWNSTNAAGFGSAKSYVPEIPWNNTCASQLLATYEMFVTSYGSSGFCNSSTGETLLEPWAGGGGPSACATGSATISGVVSGTCAGYPKPSWQSGLFGNPNDGVRDLPDVSLFAAQGPWGHSFGFCFTGNGGSCTNKSGNPVQYAFGTSGSSPIMAGVQALVNQQTGERQGNPNYRLYQLAAVEFGVNGNSACNASNGNAVGSGCIFHDVTLGGNTTACSGPYNCYAPSGTYGVLSVTSGAYAPAYGAASGWDFASGIGSVNVANLVRAWASAGEALTDSHDFNGDNKSDIVWRDSAGDVAIWLVNGASVLSAGIPGSAPGWSIVGQRDFNGDGIADLLWYDGGNVAIWFMNGTAAASSVSIGNVGTAWTVAGTGDFNGNGVGDILWQNTSGGTTTLAIWTMNGGTVASSAALGGISSQWSVVGIGDFNGSGNSDILWQDNSGDVAIWFMNGTAVSSAASLGNVGTSAGWRIVGTGDFNGDGISDILWRDTAGDLAIWLMNGSTTLPTASSTALMAGIPATWSVVQTGDYDGNGMSDILWQDTSGDVAIWFMNGTTVSSAANLGNVSGWTAQGAGAD